MEPKLIIRHVSLSKDFIRDKDGNSTGIPAVIIYYTAETLIPGSPRYAASIKVQESKLREFANDLDNLPIDFLQQFSRIGRGFEEIHETPELGWVLRADIGSLTAEMLRILHATHQTVHPAVAEARVYDDRTY